MAAEPRPTAPARIDLLDGLRAAAALSVLVAHEFGFWKLSEKDGFPVDLAMHIGTVAVAVFFAISGFVLYRPFVVDRAKGLSSRRRLRGYWIRRFARIVPAYWLTLTVYGVLTELGIGFPLHALLGHDWWAYYGFLQIYDYTWSQSGLATAWTLCIEVTFYIALPLYILAMAKRGAGSKRPNGLRRELWVLAVLSLLTLVARATLLSLHVPSVFGNSLIGTFSWFVPGMALAAIVGSAPDGALTARLRAAGARPGRCLIVAAAFFAFAFALRRIFIGAVEPPLAIALEWGLYLGIAGPIMVATVFGGPVGITRKILGNPVSLWLGQISYGIYLWHYPITYYLAGSHIIHGLPFHLATPVYAVACVVFTLIPATLSFYLVERPLLRLVSSRAARTPPGPSALAEGVEGRLQLAGVGQ